MRNLRSIFIRSFDAWICIDYKLFMQETPKPAQDEEREPLDASMPIADEKERPYYYDDAHGYETYCPDPEDEERNENAA